MPQLTSSTRENLVAARRTLQDARSFQKLATVGKESGLALPAVSNFHEAARLAIRPSRRAEVFGSAMRPALTRRSSTTRSVWRS